VMREPVDQRDGARRVGTHGVPVCEGYVVVITIDFLS
jgi:hypothetical protein